MPDIPTFVTGLVIGGSVGATSMALFAKRSFSRKDNARHDLGTALYEVLHAQEHFSPAALQQAVERAKATLQHYGWRV